MRGELAVAEFATERFLRAFIVLQAEKITFALDTFEGGV
jgi:hypothetical protein